MTMPAEGVPPAGPAPAAAGEEAGALPSERPRGWRSKALPALKILLAALAIAVLIALALLRTWPPLNVVMTGSMEPAIDPGDVVVMKRLGRPAEVGDIVAVHPPQEIQRRLQYPDTVIHRIVAITPGGKVYTKGDARKQRDPFTVQRDRIETHVVMTLPSAGRVVAFFTSPLGLIWIGLGVLLFVLLPRLERQRDLEEVELNSLTGMRFELQQLAQRVEGEHSGAAPLPPPSPQPPQPPAGYDEPTPTRSEGGELESELEEIRETIEELAGAVNEYGEHLRSHTAILQGMSAASQDLAATVAALRGVLPAAGMVPPAPPAAAQPTAPPAPQPPPQSAAERALRQEAERFIRWQERRATEIAATMGFHDPLAAARRAPLDEAADDEAIERKLWELAFENPDLLGD